MRSTALVYNAAFIALIACAASTTQAQVFVTTNTTLNSFIPNNVVPQVIVGFGNNTDANNHTNGTSPTVNVVNGFYANNGDTGFLLYNQSVLNVRGGSFYQVQLVDNSTANFFSGPAGFGLLQPGNSSTINFYGSNFSVQSTTNPQQTRLQIRGILQDGSSLNTAVLISPASNGQSPTIRFITVPEPGSVALLAGIAATGAGFLARRRRVAKNTA